MPQAQRNPCATPAPRFLDGGALRCARNDCAPTSIAGQNVRARLRPQADPARMRPPERPLRRSAKALGTAPARARCYWQQATARLAEQSPALLIVPLVVIQKPVLAVAAVDQELQLEPKTCRPLPGMPPMRV